MSILRFAGGGFRIKVYLIGDNKEYLDSNQGVYDITDDCEWLNDPPQLPATALVKLRNGRIYLIKFD